MEKWFVSAKRADFQEIGRKFGIDAVTARLIRNRDVVGDEAVREYLYGSRKDLYAPQLMKDCRKTAEILKEKIAEKKKIRVIGDYDIDGVNATCILYKGLIRCGAEADVEIPDRMKDGYGLNKNLIQYAYEEGIDTILTCDNGIAAVDEIAEAKRLGMTVLITDHHELQERIPAADAIVNPKQPECTYPYKSLCGAAVAYKLMICLYELCGIPVEETDAFIEFAAIATVGDVMDLTGENRILVKEGLKMINQTSNRGLKALIRANGLEDAQISSYHIGFVLGPCINASGRLDTAKRALELLLAEDDAVAEDLAHTLKELNDERKDMTQQGVAQAIELIEEGVLKEDKVLVVYLPDCHESLAGIIAGRIRERYHKPVFVLTDAADGLKGSGRSIETYNMFAEMSKCAELFTKFGGHPMAAGLSLPRENMEAFHKKINENSVLTEDDFIPKVTIDVPMPISYITERLVEELGLLEPFGKGNTKPLFAEKSLNILSARILGKNRNVIKLQVLGAAGTVMEAMYFGDVERFQEYLREKFGHTETEKLFQGRENAVTLSLAYYPGINEFRGNRTLQIVIQSYQ
ncbi:MAG: single-stranded-DNA-specific exonuclease RecJ [Lachnospiraceae bacterium]|nr:single-stranded-DNA-specific exonuclease RecJ [Lachnospiraceae bacterium]MCI9660756.1 single-stranded-DNA-specific exonuclease RecJ [Lachnospiraceae bacterium]